MSDALLDALWHKVEENWSDESAHDRFLNQASEQRQLPLAAARYRAASSERGQSSEQYLARIAALAMSQIDASRTPHAELQRNAQYLVAVVLFLALALALLLQLR